MRRWVRRWVGILVAAVGLAGSVTLIGAQWRRVNGEEALYAPPNPRYDGRFTYARIKFTQNCCVYGGRYRDVKWGHDYPRADFHLPKILEELTTMRVRTDGSAIVALDDPELFKFPFAYLCEVGYWLPSDPEVVGLRNYLLKGGFVIVDDFERSHWYNFEEQMKRVLPAARLIPLTAAHPIFDSFYRIESLEYWDQNFGTQAQFYGVFEDNDPTRRMMMIVNYNFDVSEFWEHSNEGFFPVALTNEAYKLGVNYLIYAFSR
ncbi:MAG TPA: DUF4159 domain-containing protein [Gemmatimonadales bacterium]|nr:DUF4159 domain-containing protein [Gemmatimonadales bacterium]